MKYHLLPLFLLVSIVFQTLGVFAHHFLLENESPLTTHHSLINNQGDVRKSMKDLASTDTVISMATAMATAGVMDGVFGGGEEPTTAGEGASTAGEGASSFATTPSPTTASPAGGASQAASGGTRSILDMSTLEKFQHHLPRTALNMGTATGCHMAVEGKMPSAKGLVQNAVQAVAQSVAHTCANEIGGWYGNNRVDVVSHKLLHGLLGAGLGAAVSKNRTEGAIVGAGSALAAELIAEMMGPSVDDLQSKARAGTLTHDDIESYWEQVNDTANAARLLTAGAVALTGKDTEAAVAASSNALDNNYLEAAYAATQAHDKPLTEEQRQAGEEFLFDDIELLQSLKEVVEGPARDRIEYVLARLQQDSLNLLEVPDLIALLKSSTEEFIAAQFIPTSRFDVALEGASLVTLGMGKVLPMSMRLLRTLQSERSVLRALSSFTSRTSARVGLRGAEHVGGEVAHLASPSEFGAKFKKSVGFADDFGAPLEFRATYDPHKPGFTVVETPTHSVKPSAVANELSRVKRINGRMPINYEYSNEVFPLQKLPELLRQKYPHSVPFTGTGHPDFSRYAIKKVKIKVTGDRTPRSSCKCDTF